MNAGVSKPPCGVVTRPARARVFADLARISNRSAAIAGTP
jgi:hypothetical protein